VIVNFLTFFAKYLGVFLCYIYVTTMATKITSKNINYFLCEKCNFKCSKKGDWNRHILTAKHQNVTNCNEITSNDNEITSNYIKPILCNCGKNFNNRTSLWRHKKTCNETNTNSDTDTNIVSNNNISLSSLFDLEPILHLIKQNQEFKELLIEQNKQLIELSKDKSINNSNNTNCNNNKFNLNFYLNQTCKDALNITDFVSTLQLQVGDLEETGRLGFSEGISRIFINGLKQLDVTKRPVHCSDIKREVMYVKDDNQWNKEDADKQKLTNAIKTVANKNFKQLPQWQKQNPTYYDPDSKANDKYMQIISESLSGSNKAETENNYNKIIKNIAKQTIIEKESDN